MTGDYLVYTTEGSLPGLTNEIKVIEIDGPVALQNVCNFSTIFRGDLSNRREGNGYHVGFVLFLCRTWLLTFGTSYRRSVAQTQELYNDILEISRIIDIFVDKLCIPFHKAADTWMSV